MKEVKVMPKFKCDFCKKRMVKQFMTRHEPSCYLNPNRTCWQCEDTGEVDAGADYYIAVPCPSCEKYKEINEEKKKQEEYIKELDKELGGDGKVPF